MARRGLIFHRKANGRVSRKWYTLVDKKLTPLESYDPSEAREQAKQLRSSRGAAADIDAAGLSDDLPTPAPKAPAAAASPPAEPPAPSPEPAAAAEELGGKTGEYSNGKTNGAGAGFGADVNQAAAESQQAADAENDPIVDAELDDFLDDVIGAAAGIAVELQVRLQEWAWRRYGKIQVAQVAPTDASREAGGKLWGKAFRRWLPKKIPIPDWVAAIAFVGMQTTKVQLGPGAHQVGKPPAGANGQHAADADFVEVPFREAA